MPCTPRKRAVGTGPGWLLRTISLEQGAWKGTSPSSDRLHGSDDVLLETWLLIQQGPPNLPSKRTASHTRRASAWFYRLEGRGRWQWKRCSPSEVRNGGAEVRFRDGMGWGCQVIVGVVVIVIVVASSSLRWSAGLAKKVPRLLHRIEPRHVPFSFLNVLRRASSST